jgi:hypothetical protein
MSHNVKITIDGKVVGSLIEFNPSENEVTTKESINEFTFYLKRGEKHYFKGVYGKMMIEHRALSSADLKKGQKVIIRSE